MQIKQVDYYIRIKIYFQTYCVLGRTKEWVSSFLNALFLQQTNTRLNGQPFLQILILYPVFHSSRMSNKLCEIFKH